MEKMEPKFTLFSHSLVETMVLFLVIGSSLRSNGYDQAAAGMRFIAEVKTKACYHLYSLDDKYAALVPLAEKVSTRMNLYTWSCLPILDAASA